MRRLSILILAFLLAAIAAPAAFAEEGVDTTTVNFSILGNTVMGTVVERYTATGTSPVQISDETWTFTGQINGLPASASGKWQGTWDGKSYIGNITEITTWNMGTLKETSVAGKVIYPAGTAIPKPAVPLAISAKPGDGNAIWLVLGLRKLGEQSIPVAVQGAGIDASSGRIAPPGQGQRTFSLTNVAGTGAVIQLPRTGEAPEWLNLVALATLMLGAGAFGTSRLMLRRAG